MRDARPSHIVFVELTGFYAACATGRKTGAPLAVMQGGVCIDVSLEAYRCGVRPGLTRRQAVLACADITFAKYCEPVYAAPARRFLQVLHRLSPAVEPVDYHRAFVELRNGADGAMPAVLQFVEAIAQDLEGLAFLAFAGMGNSKLVSRAAALCLAEEVWKKHAAGHSVGEAASRTAGCAVNCKAVDLRTFFVDDEEMFLENLPIRFLWKLPEDVRRKIEALGLKTAGDVARISQADLIVQFGRLGYDIYRLSRGIDDDPVKPYHPFLEIVRRVSFDGGVASLEAVEKALEMACRQIGCELRNIGYGAGRICVEVTFDNGRKISGSRRFSSPRDSGRSLEVAAKVCLADMGLAGDGVVLPGADKATRVEEVVVSIDELGKLQREQMFFPVWAAPVGYRAAALSLSRESSKVAAVLECTVASLGKRYERDVIIKGSDLKPSRREIVLSLWDPIRAKGGWAR